MKLIRLLVFLSLAVTGHAQQRVIIIGLDGFSVEGFNTARIPNITHLLSEGTYSLTTRPVMPSVTMPNWTSHLTGSGPEEHGVTDNTWTPDKHQLEAIDKDAGGYYPSVFKVLKEQVPGMKTGYYYNWKELIYPINREYLDEVSFEADDLYEENYRKAFNFMVANKNAPTLVFLYSVHTDHAGHTHKWMSPQYIKALEDADAAIGRLIEKLKAEKLYKDTHFLLITDHGGIEKSHGGVSMQEMQVPWGVTGPKIKRRGLAPFYNSNKNTALVVARIFNLRSKKIPECWTGQIPGILFR